MKQVFLIVILILILPLQGKSQRIVAGIESGMGAFSMKGLKEFNEIGMQEVPFDTKVVEDFPMYFYYRPYILLNINNVSFGPVYTFQSTGSRVSAKDYSGEYRFDMIVNSSAPGIYGEVNLYQFNKIHSTLTSIFGFLFSNLRMKEFLKVQEEVLTDESYKFKSFNLFLEPGFKISYPVRFLNFGINAGYQIQFGIKSFHLTDNKDAKLINPESGDPVKPDWNGFRVGLSVSCLLPLSSKLPVNY